MKVVVAGGGSVGRVVAGHVPLGAGHVVTVVVIHSQNVLHGQDVAVGSQAQVLLDALGNNTSFEEVHRVLLRVGCSAAGQSGQLVVNDNPQARKGGNFSLGDADAAKQVGAVLTPK